MMLYWIVMRNRIRVISCNWEQGIVQFYLCWRWQNTLGRGSHCIISISTSGARNCKAERLATCYHHIKQESASLQSFPFCPAMGSTRKLLWYYLALLTLIITEPQRVHRSEKRAENTSGQPQFRLTLVPRENKRGKLTSCSRKLVSLWVFFCCFFGFLGGGGFVFITVVAKSSFISTTEKAFSSLEIRKRYGFHPGQPSSFLSSLPKDILR